MNALLMFALAATLGTAQVKEVPLQDPFANTYNTLECVESVERVESEREYEIVVFDASAYCKGACCCGKWANGYTASGTVPQAGRTIAAPPEYEFGTEIEIEGITYVVEDRGSAIKGNKVDIYFDTHAEALQFGRQSLEGKVYK